MNRRRFIGLALGAAAAGVAARHSFHHGMGGVERSGWALGAEVSLTAYHQDHETAELAVQEAFRALDQLEDVLSLYRPHSLLNRLNRAGIQEEPHPDLVAVLDAALRWARRTDGAFDPSVQPLWELHTSGGRPGERELLDALELVDYRRIQIDARTARLGPGQALTLNGIAQGFAADRVREILQRHGVQHALINTGEYGAVGQRPSGTEWRVGIQHPRSRDALIAVAAMRDRFLATSGDYETIFATDFSSHHIFDPRTGRSPTALSSVTVLAPTGLEADALSTAIFVLGPDRGLELAASLPAIDVLMVLKDGEVRTTPRFPSSPEAV